MITFLINVTAHEVGHGSHALPPYDQDDRAPGSILHPDPADAGTTMEQGVPAETLGEEVRSFSGEDVASGSSLIDVEVEEDYTYASIGGRVSKRDTAVRMRIGTGTWSRVATFDQSWYTMTSVAS